VPEKFADLITTIRVIHITTGSALYNYATSEKTVDDALVSGLVTAIFALVKEVENDQIKYIQMERNLTFYAKTDDFLIIASIEGEYEFDRAQFHVITKIATAFVSAIGKEFYERFGSLANWGGNVDQFPAFDENVASLLERYNISI
jgi:hypothetical protein